MEPKSPNEVDICRQTENFVIQCHTETSKKSPSGHFLSTVVNRAYDERLKHRKVSLVNLIVVLTKAKFQANITSQLFT
jgi:hypothetical protein